MKNKRAEIFGMSFSMIFSIILIVFFIIVAFVGFKYFFKWQKCNELTMFVNDFEFRIEEVWKSDLGASINFSSTLPSEIEYVCIMNLKNQTISATNKEQDLFNIMKSSLYGKSINDNLYFYSPDSPLCVKSKNSKDIKYINLQQKNPICIKVINKKFFVKIEKDNQTPLINIIP